jgi:hypothetical protein
MKHLEGHVYKLLILSRFANKHGRQFLKVFSSETAWPNEPKHSRKRFGQSQTRTANGGHISCMMVTKYSHFVQNLPGIIPTKQQLMLSPSFRGEDFLNVNQQKQEVPLTTRFVAQWV